MGDLTKSDIEDIIDECLNDKSSLKEVIVKIKSISTDCLSDYDHVFIEGKYCDLLIDRWLAESEEYIKSSTNPNQLLGTIQTITSLETLTDCCNLIGNCGYNILIRDLNKHSKSLKLFGKKCIHQFKEVCLNVVSLQTNGITSEIAFVEKCIELLKLCKDPSQVCSDIQINDFLNGQDVCNDFRNFLSNLKECEAIDRKYAEIKQLGNDLLNENTFYLSQGLKETIQSYLEPVIVLETFVDGRVVLEVSGKHVILSRVLPEIELEPRFSEIEEVRFVRSDVIHIDADFVATIWHGKNIVIRANSMIVSNNHCVWNVSGKDGRNTEEVEHENETADCCELAASDGHNAESGGNVMIIVGQLKNGENLEIISKGGNGSNGLDGRKGKDGIHGKTISNSELKLLYPPVSKLINSSKNVNLKETHKNVLQCLKSVDYLYYNGTNYAKQQAKQEFVNETLFKHSSNIESLYFEVTTDTGCKLQFSFYNEGVSFCQSFLLYKGSVGTEGTPGQRGGRGGKGGFGGEIDILVSKDNGSNISKCSVHGQPGTPGKVGESGKPGKFGLDKGYMDCTFTLFGADWPKYFFLQESDNITLTVKYTNDKPSSSKKVWAPHLNMYAEITESSREFRRNNSVQTENSESSESNFKENSSRKKTISLESVLDRYGENESVNFSQLSNYVNNAMTVIDDFLSKEVDFKQSSEEVKVAQKITFESYSRVSIDWFDTMADIQQIIPGKENSSDPTLLLKQVEQSPNDVLTCKVLIILARVRMSLKQLNILWKIVDPSKAFISNQLVKLTIKKLNPIFFCDKYKLAVLEDIESRKLHDDLTWDESMDIIANRKSLVENALVVKKQGCGRVAKFFVEDSPEKREEVLQICENFADDESFKSSLKIFLQEFGNSLTMPLKSKEILNKFLTFEQFKIARLKQSLELLKNELVKPRNSRLHQMLIESIIEDNGSKLVQFHSEIKSPVSYTDCSLLSKLFCIYSKILKNNFTWIGLEDNMGNVDPEIKLPYFDCIIHIGINSRCYRDFLALYFDINIIIYVRNDNKGLVLMHNHNDKSTQKIYLLKEGNTYSELEINKGLVQMITAHISKGKIYSQAMLQINSLNEKEDFDVFLNNEPYKAASYNGISKGSRIVTRVLNILSQDDDIKLIQNAFVSPEDKIVLGTRLEKLKIEYSGNDNILHFMGLHFKTEDNVISSKELCFIINIILKFTSEDDLMPLVSWIVAAYPHSSWLVELSLLKLETYFNATLDPNRKVTWREYLTKQNDGETLMLLHEKINDNQGSRLSIEHVEEVLSLISIIPRAYIGLEQVDILEWKYHLKDKYWAYKVMNITSNWSEDGIKFVSYYLLSLENKKGTQFCNKILSLINSPKYNITESDKSAIETTLRLLTGDEISIDDKILALFSENQISDWPNLIKATLNSDQYHSVQELISLIKSSNNTTEPILTKLDHIFETLRDVNSIVDELNRELRDESQLKAWFEMVTACLKRLDTSQVQEESLLTSIHKSYTDFIKMLLNYKDTKDSKINENGSDNREELNINEECLNRIVVATVIISIDLLLGKKLRETQKLTILTFLMSGKNILGQVATGEGKSLIVVSIAIIKAVLSGHSVDIITSSNVLAERDAKLYEKVYLLFKVGVGNNCSQNVEERKKTYSNCKVVYGELASFQRDFLLDRFYGKNILGDRKFELTIVDEVDSMLLDQSNSMLYLSHEIPGVDKLEPIFVFIWKWLIMPKQDGGNDLAISTLKHAIKFELFGLIKMENIRDLDTNLSDNQVLSTWEYLINEGVIDNQGHLLMESIDESKVTVKDRPNCIPENHFRYLLNKVVKRNKQLEVPNHLRHFVKAHLDNWINSAVTALRLEINVHYVVGVNRSPTNINRAANIIILNHHTGSDMVNSHWDEGLHQFLELKHGCRLSLISLKAVFKSNVSYFKQYKLLYGLTGTLGSNQDRHMLKEMYSVEFVTIPTAKPTKLFQDVPQVHYCPEAWISAIIENAYNLSETRSVLIVCETIKDVSLLEENLNIFLSKNESQRIIVSYKRDYELVKALSEKSLTAEPGHIIISTNLAGRGTDIKLSENLKNAGGLHVCLTFLPTNSRIEEQAYGRVARNGEPGSSQLIIKSPTNVSSVSKIIDLKNERDSIENIRIGRIKDHYNKTVKKEEELLTKFEKCYKKLKDDIKTPDEDMKQILLQDCLDQWAFRLDLDQQSSNLSLDPIDTLIEKLSKLVEIDLKCWPQYLKNPSHLLRLGIICFKMKKYKLAISFFDQVIKNEPSFAEIAYYYRPLAKAKESDLDKDHVICDFVIARKLLKTRVDTILINAQTIDWLKDHNTKSSLQIDSFKEQQENILRTYNVFLDSIDTVLGFGVDFQEEIKDITNELIECKVISNLTIKKGLGEDDLNFLEKYGIASKKMICFLNGISQFDVKSFQKAFPLPSKELFWKELIEQNVLINEQKYVFVNMSELDSRGPLARIIRTVTIQVEPSHENQVWIYEPGSMNMMEGYSVCRKHALVDKLGIYNYTILKLKGIFQTNKQATLFGTNEHFNFKYFNSISYEDFQNIGICNATSADILDELQKENVLVENKSSNKKQFSLLLLNVDQIECIELIKCKAYTEDVRSLLKFHFSFGLAMKEYSNHLLGNENRQISLKRKPHKVVLNILIEHNIIKSVVNPDTSPKNVLNTLYRDEMSTDDWEKLFVGVYDEAKNKRVVSDLIHHKWIISVNRNNPCNWIVLKYKLNTNRDGKIQNPTLSEEFRNDCDTIEFVLSNYLAKLTNIDEYKCFLNAAKGFINTVETPDFKLIPLRGILQSYNQPTSEISIFTLNGLDQLLELGEKTWTFKMKRDICIATLFGLAQVAVGSSLLCMQLVKTGIDDLIHCVNCMFTGTFHWKDYFIDKLISLVQIVKMPLSKLFSNSFGNFTSFSVQSLKGAGCKFIDGCKNLTRNMLLSSKGESFYLVCSRVWKALGASVISNTFNVVQSKIEFLGKNIMGLFDLYIEKTLMSHVAIVRAKRLHQILGKRQAKEVIDKVCSVVGNEYRSISKFVWSKTLKEIMGMYNVACGLLKVKFPSNLSDILDTGNVVYELFSKMKNLLQKGEYKTIIFPVTHFLDTLEKLLQKEINVVERSRGVDGVQPLEDVSSEDFSLDMFFQFKDCVKNQMSSLLNDIVIGPLLCKTNNWLINRYLKVTNKTFNELFSNQERALISKSKGPHFTDQKFEVNKKSQQVPSYVDREYDNYLLQSLKTRKNNAVFAEILKRNTEIDISCLDFCCSVIPAVLKKHGINVLNLEIIVDRSGAKEIYKTYQEKSASVTIHISTSEGVLNNLKSNKVLVKGILNAIVLAILPNDPQIQTIAEYFLEEILLFLESGLAGEHAEENAIERNETLSPENDSYQHLHPDGSWTLNPTVDSDIREKRNAPKITMTEPLSDLIKNHIQLGFNLALNMINNHIHKVQVHLKHPFSLILEDFNESKHDIFPPTSSDLNMFHGRAIEYELVMPFKVKGGKITNFIITLKLVNKVCEIQPLAPHGPHIAYQVEPSNEAKYMNLGVKGHVLLDKECSRNTFTVKDCRVAGDLIQPTGSKFTMIETRKKFDVLILGDSVLRYIQDHINKPSWEIKILQNLDVEPQSVLSSLAQCFISFKCIVVHLGTSLVQVHQTDEEIAQHVINIVNQVMSCFAGAKVIMLAIHQRKIGSVEERNNPNIIRVNGHLKKYCESKGLIYVETSRFIGGDDLEMNGKDLNKTGYKKLASALKKLLNVTLVSLN